MSSTIEIKNLVEWDSLDMKFKLMLKHRTAKIPEMSPSFHMCSYFALNFMADWSIS